MFELLNKGGFVMYAILLASIFALAIIIERAVFFYSTKKNFNQFMHDFTASLYEGGRGAAMGFLEGKTSGLAGLARTYLDNNIEDKSILEEYLYNWSNREVRKQEQNLNFLSAIGHLAPLMGLLGTVLGMITCFQEIHAIGGQADVSTLAGGIWEALLTTAYGLLVAIPVIGAHHYLETVVDRRTDSMQELMSEMDIYFGKNK